MPGALPNSIERSCAAWPRVHGLPRGGAPQALPPFPRLPTGDIISVMSRRLGH
jgi:hypothetical protein